MKTQKKNKVSLNRILNLIPAITLLVVGLSVNLSQPSAKQVLKQDGVDFATHANICNDFCNGFATCLQKEFQNMALPDDFQSRCFSGCSKQLTTAKTCLSETKATDCNQAKVCLINALSN